MRQVFDWIIPIAIWAIGAGFILSSLPAVARTPEDKAVVKTQQDDSWIPVNGGPSQTQGGTRYR